MRDESTSSSPFVPRHLEVSFRAFELEPGVVVSGKIDRVDGDRMGARGIVVDYKSGAASSASEIRERDLLQLPLYMLVLRRPARARAGRRRVRAGRRRPPATRDAALRARRHPRVQRARLPRARRVRRGGRRGEGHGGRARRADPGRRRASRPARAASALTGAISGACAGRTVREGAPQRPAASRDRGDGQRLRGRRRGHRQDGGARRALRPRGRRRGARRRLAARDHVHGAGRGRAPGHGSGPG